MYDLLIIDFEIFFIFFIAIFFLTHFPLVAHFFRKTKTMDFSSVSTFPSHFIVNGNRHLIKPAEPVKPVKQEEEEDSTIFQRVFANSKNTGKTTNTWKKSTRDNRIPEVFCVDSDLSCKDSHSLIAEIVFFLSQKKALNANLRKLYAKTVVAFSDQSGEIHKEIIETEIHIDVNQRELQELCSKLPQEIEMVDMSEAKTKKTVRFKEAIDEIFVSPPL
jgi:hypothetical protein